MYHNTHRIAPLPVRVAPQPWEDLHSFLSRTAKQMQYEHVNQIIRASNESVPHCLFSDLSRGLSRADYRFLGDLLLRA